MPEPEPRSTPNRRRRWRRRIFGVLAIAPLAAGAAVFLAVKNLDWLATWSIHRFFPGVRAELGSLRVAAPTRLEVRRLALKSSRTGEPLLALEGGSVSFRFSDVWRLRLDEVRLERPDLVVSPDLGEALGVKPAKSGAAPAGRGALGWGIGRLTVTDGHLRVTRFGARSPSVDLDFSADLRNFGVGGDAGAVEHEARLGKIAAADASGHPFLALADAGLRFTTEELFSHDHLRALRIGRGSLTIAPNLAEAFAPGPNADPAADVLPWSVGALAFDGVQIVVVNAPGPIGRMKFHVSAALQNLGAVGPPAGSALQHLTVTGLEVSTDRRPNVRLLTADEARASFTVAGLRARRLEEISLASPLIDHQPDVPPKDSSPADADADKTDAEWSIGRAVCPHGVARVHGLKNGALAVSTHFAFDLRDFGSRGDRRRAPLQLTIWDAQATLGAKKAFLSIDAAQARFTVAGLLEDRHVDAAKVTGGRVLVGDAFQKLLSGNPSAEPLAPARPTRDWSIGALDVFGVRLRLEDRRPGVPDVRMTLNTSLVDVAASGVSSQLLDQVQTVELANIDLDSPLDRKVKIFTLRSVFLRFTLRDLAAKHLREVVIREPIIYLSRDLFVYMERVSADESGAKTPAAPAAGDWSADRVQVRSGKLVIGSGGQKDVGLPLQFETTLDDVALDNLAKLKVQAALRVPKQSYEFPDYRLSVRDVEGDLRFAYPPEKGEKNLVQKLDIQKIRWRQFQSDRSWIAVTFDARGINGQFGGESYHGYVNGGFSFNFLDDAPWQGWVAGTGVDTEALTAILSPQNFSLTGPLDFEVQVDAFRKNVERMAGNFRVKEPGHLRIGKLDAVLADLPPAWTAIKSSATRLALETLRDFDYAKAAGDFWFVESQGILGLHLTGPLGSRTFEVALHDDQDTQNPWQRGKLGKP